MKIATDYYIGEWFLAINNYISDIFISDIFIREKRSCRDRMARSTEVLQTEVNPSSQN